MSDEVTRCPRCESTSVVHLPVSIRFSQWLCSQCSHQWDFASREERAIVPNQLTGGRIEQFLEEFLAIKTVIRGEAEKLWRGCADAHQAISIAVNEDKPRVFGEYVDRWRDQLIGLQEALIIDRLLPLVVKYQVSSNEQMWLFRSCHEAWSPVSAGYVDWFLCTIRGQLYGGGPWVIPEWAWRLRGAPRDIGRLDVDPEQKALALLDCLAETLGRDLVEHRKEAIAKAFLAREPSESPTRLRSLAENLKRPEASRDKVLADIRERFLTDAAFLRIENCEGVRDRLAHNSDQNGAFNRPRKVAITGFREWMENLGRFAAGQVMTLARMASAHSEWSIADPAEWARIQVAEFVDDELYPKRCRKCGKPRSKHSGTDHECSKAMSRIELWWRMVSGEEEDFDRYEYGRPERWSAPVRICKNPEKTENFLRARHFDFDERLKWVLHDAEGDARIELCLASVNPGAGAALAPGAPNAEPLRFANGNSKLPGQPLKTDSDAWIRRADDLLAKHPSANYHRASELYQFATSMLSALYGVESSEMQSLRSNAELASRDRSAFQAGHISLLAQGAIKAARDDLKAGLIGNLKTAPEIVPVSTIEGAVTGGLFPKLKSVLAKRSNHSTSGSRQRPKDPVAAPAEKNNRRPRPRSDRLLSSYRSEIKRAILTQLALNPKATDVEICRRLDADGSVELPSSWKAKVSDRGFFDAYSDAVRRHKVEVTISKVRKDLRRQGFLD
jgi:hypothetical protein